MHAKQIIQYLLRATTTVLLIACVAVECLAQPIIPSADQDLARRLASVDDLLEVEDWDRAIDVLESVQISGDQNVIKVDNRLMLRASEYARILLTRLPKPALQRYRERFEPRTDELWQQADLTGNVSLLKTILRETFLTRTAEKAINRLAELALQAGDYEAAHAYWLMLVPLESSEALLVRYPDPDTRLPDVLAKLIVTRVLSAEHELAQFELSVYRERFPDAEGTLAGKTGKWTDLLSDLLTSSTNGSPPVFSIATRGQMPVDVGAQRWSLPVHNPEKLTSYSGLRHHPVVWNQYVFWNDGTAIMGYNIQTGLGAWIDEPPQSLEAWVRQGRVYPTQVDPFDFRPLRPVHGETGETLSISQGRLFARLGGPITGFSIDETRQQPSRLICLDLKERQGQLVWDFNASQLDRNLRFEGSPVVKDKKLWILGRRGATPSELYLLCFRAEDGHFLWNRLICSNSAQVPEGSNYASSLGLLWNSGQVYVSTELGAVAAFDAIDGLPVWYHTYPRTTNPEKAGTTSRLSAKLLIHEGILIAAPGDSDRVFALEQQTGETLWSQPKARDQQLLGIAKDRVFLTGNHLEARHLADGQREWQFSSRAAELQGQGAGVVTHDTIWWPTSTEILVFDTVDGRMTRRINLLRNHQLQGGNLVGHPSGLILANPTHMTVFSPWGEKPTPEP
jgi:outer membrane protein assembly factor BamB